MGSITTLHTGIDEVVRQELYLVYSTNRRPPSLAPAGIVNIWVLRLDASRIVVFGSGFGDPDGDHEAYNTAAGQRDAPQRSAGYDARQVDHVVHACMGMPASAAIDVTFVVPHAHLDHVNQEFFDALATLGLGPREVLIHQADLRQATCGAACCGTPLGSTACNDPRDPDFGAPFETAWRAEWLSRFRTIGAATDRPCLTIVQSFNAGGLGIIDVVFNGGHTPGTVDLRTRPGAPLSLVMGGAFGAGTCQPQTPGIRVGAHDNLVL